MINHYGNYSNGGFQVLIALSDKSWGAGNPENGATNCTESFRVMNGQEGIDENIKNRIFSLALTAFTADKKIALYVNTSTGPHCTVKIGRIYNP